MESSPMYDETTLSRNGTIAISWPDIEEPSSDSAVEKFLYQQEKTAPSVLLDDQRQEMTAIPTSKQSATSSISQEGDFVSIQKRNERTKVVVIGLLWLLGALSSLDRVAMSVALVPMTDEFGFTDSVKGSISSLFSVGYGLCIVPAGLIVANASPRIVMATGLVLWSAATIATPFATEASSSMIPLLGARACVGAAESVLVPTMQRFLATWTNSEEKSTVFGTIQTGLQFGTISAYLVSPLIMDLGTWRDVFYVYGTLGILFLVPWLALAQDRPLPMTSQEQTDEIVAQCLSEERPQRSNIQIFRDAPWKELLQSKGCWGMLFVHCSKNWSLYNTLAWTPTFFYEQYGIGVHDSAILSILPCIAGAVGALIAGNLADLLIRQIPKEDVESLTNTRKLFQAIASFGPAVSLGTLAWNIPSDPHVAQYFLMASLGLQAFNSAGFESGLQDKAGEKWAGLLYSVTTLPAVIFGTFGVWWVGQVLDLTEQDWSVVFSMNSAVSILGAVAFLLLYDSKKEFD